MLNSLNINHLSYVAVLARIEVIFFFMHVLHLLAEYMHEKKCHYYSSQCGNVLLQGSNWILFSFKYNWKLLHLTEHKLNPNCPREAEEYERATKYNYNSLEKVAIIEVISMIKGLQALMYRLENAFKEAINLTTYNELQTFVQSDLRDMIRKATSRKKDLTKSILLAVRDTCVDWFKGKEPEDDPALRGKKDPESGFKIERPPRYIGPSSTQVKSIA